jgi:sugar fermentation stimulation protein A
MQFATPLIPATLIRRYKRFLADCKLDTGETVTATCPNTGALLGCCEPGSRIWLSKSASPTRKYAHAWELTDRPDLGLTGINTSRPNALVEEALAANRIEAL